MSRKCVPWPGRRTSSIAKPRAAKSSDNGRSDAGLPVKPCTNTMPIRARGPEPFEDQGSLPGSTGKVTAASLHETRGRSATRFRRKAVANLARKSGDELQIVDPNVEARGRRSGRGDVERHDFLQVERDGVA